VYTVYVIVTFRLAQVLLFVHDEPSGGGDLKLDLSFIQRAGIILNRNGHLENSLDMTECRPLWSSGQSFWLQIPRPRVRFPALPDFLRSSGSGTGSTLLRKDNWRATWMKSSDSGLENRDLTTVGIRCADHATPLYPQKLTLTSPTRDGRSVGIVRLRTKATEFRVFLDPSMPHFVKAGWVVLKKKHAAGNIHHNANILYISRKECITSKRYIHTHQ
jgi:hypothetical protein